MRRPLAFRSLKVATLSERKETKGRDRRYDIVVWAARGRSGACRAPRRRDSGGARGDRAGSGGSVPVVWGGVHLGEGPSDDLSARHPLLIALTETAQFCSS